MSSPKPMQTRRRRPPGFPNTAEPATDTAVRATQPQHSTEGRDSGTPTSGTDASDETSPYAGASTRQFNTRLLTPLHHRYARLVRGLQDDGYDTSVTELVQAVLHYGPSTPDDARAAVRAWRQLRATE